MILTEEQLDILKYILNQLPEKKQDIGEIIMLDSQKNNRQNLNKVKNIQYRYFDGEGLILINNIREKKYSYQNIFTIKSNKILFNPQYLSNFIEENE